MAAKLRDGDYIADGLGGVVRTEGTEDLSEETGLRVASVALTDRGSGAVTVTAELVWEGRTLSVDVEVPV